MTTLQMLMFAWLLSVASQQKPVDGFAGSQRVEFLSNGGPEVDLEAQDIAAMKVKAVYDYLQTRLGERILWECGTDLENDIDLYLPNADDEGNHGDVYIPLSEITLADGKLDPTSEERIERILVDRSL